MTHKHVQIKANTDKLCETHYKHKAPTARLLALQLMSPMRTGKVDDAGYSMMNENCK